MDAYTTTYEVRWTDIDANRHVRYSAYIDAAAEQRFRFFNEHGLPPEVFDRLDVGPVYTTLLVNFFREVLLGESLTIQYLLTGLSPSGTRWKVQHLFLKSNGKKAVSISLEGTVLNLTTRQPVAPTPEIMAVFQQVPRSKDFEELSESRWFKPAG
jgi:acyl-CoA thioester hydrolase